MSEPVNVLIMIHGIVSDPLPSNPFDTYEAFYNALVNVKRDLADIIDDKRIYVQWGHEIEDTPPDQIRVDQKLTRAQAFIDNRVSYDAVRTDPSPNNILLSGLFGSDYGIPGLRNVITSIRERVVLFGFGDVIYYCSPEGEENIRRVVYRQVLTELDKKFKNKEHVRLHIVGHSLGVTLAHDFLYGLFATDHQPDFITEHQGDKTTVELYKKWRKHAQDGQLQVGTMISLASQLPIFMMRKQKLVDKFFNEELLDPADIGILDQTIVHWLLFYDIDDILAFPTRPLYQPNHAIKEVQVDTDDIPHIAHTEYWVNKTVIRETANLIFHNSQLPLKPTNLPL